MIDICFSEVSCGILHDVKKLIKSDDILSLGLHYYHGYLDCDIIEHQAKSEVDTLRYYYKDITEEELEEEYQEYLKEMCSAFKKLDKHLKNGQQIRLWISSNANDRCGLYWFCNYTKQYNNKIFTVLCPGYYFDDIRQETYEYRTWASICNPYYMASFANSACELSNNVKNLYAELWDYLVKENSPLRILIDDAVVSTTEDFFDKIILGFITETPKQQALIIGQVLGKWNCCKAAFVSERIERLIESNVVKICEEKVDDDGCYWSRTIALT